MSVEACGLLAPRIWVPGSRVALLILFLLRATSNALATLPGPPYSVPSSSSNVMDSAQPGPVCSMSRKLPQPSPGPLSGACIRSRMLTQSPSGDMESQKTELGTARLPALHIPVAYRQTVGCFVATMASRIRYSFYIRWSLRCPYPPTLRIHTHCHHRLFSVSSPPPQSLLIPAVYPF